MSSSNLQNITAKVRESSQLKVERGVHIMLKERTGTRPGAALLSGLTRYSLGLVTVFFGNLERGPLHQLHSSLSMTSTSHPAVPMQQGKGLRDYFAVYPSLFGKL